MRLIPRFPSGKSLRVKRFMARYILYLEIFGYVAVSLVALAIVACFFFKVDDVIRHQGDPVAIKPRAEAIKRAADALVTRVFVRNHQEVRRGDPLVEIVESPEWMSRYLITRQMRTLLDEFNAPGQAEELAKKRIEEAQKEAREAALAGVKKTGPALTEAEEEEEEEKEPLPVVSLSPEEEKLRALAQQRLADWEASVVPKAPRIVIRAPIDGIVVAPDDLDFKKVDADAEILKVVDLNDLRITAKASGEKVADAREGQKVIIKAIVPDYKKGVVFRGDTVPKGRWFWQKERVISYGILDPELKDMIKEGFKDQKITQRDDIPFELTEVTDVEVNTEVETSVQPSAVSNQQSAVGSRQSAVRMRTAHAATAPYPTPNTQHPTPPSPVPGQPPGAAPPAGLNAQRSTLNTPPGDVVVADMPSELELTGKVLEGKHLLKVQIADMPPEVRQKVMESVASKIRGKTFLAPQEAEEEGGPTTVQALRVEEIRGAQIIAKVKGENKEAKGPTKRLKKEARQKAIRGASLEREYEATVQIQNPPQFLKDRVLELLEEGKEVKAKIQVTTGRRRVAFLLLKR